jgi:hypothetical protein
MTKPLKDMTLSLPKKLAESVSEEDLELLNVYWVKCASAYNNLIAELMKALMGLESKPPALESKLFNLDLNEHIISEKVDESIKSITGRCGAYIAAAGKTCQASHLSRIMQPYNDIDMTPHVANEIAIATIGRGIARRQRAMFATPGRDYADRSKLYGDKKMQKRLGKYIDKASEEISKVDVCRAWIRADLAAQYRAVWDSKPWKIE